MNWLDFIFWWTGAAVCAGGGMLFAFYVFTQVLLVCLDGYVDKIRACHDWIVVGRELNKQGKLWSVNDNV